MPDEENLSGVLGVERNIGDNMNYSGSDDGGRDNPQKGFRDPFVGLSSSTKASLEITVGDIESDRKSDAVGVHLERPYVEGDGYWFHFSLRLAPSKRYMS